MFAEMALRHAQNQTPHCGKLPKFLLDKTIGTHYSGRPREFIEIVRSCAESGGDAARLEAELLACATPEPNEVSARAMSAIESAAAAQVARAAGIWKAVA